MYLSTPNLESAAITLSSLFNQTYSPPHDSIHLQGGVPTLQRWSSLIGIITAIIGNILISFALNIQRYAHIRLHEEQAQRKEKLRGIPKARGGYGTTGTNGHSSTDANGDQGEHDALLRNGSSRKSQATKCTEEDHKDDTNYLQSPYWWGGIVLMTIGEAGNFLAYGFAPASIVSPLGVVALVSNCVIAPIMLKERFRWRDFFGVVVAVGGAVTVVLSAKTEEKKLGPHEIWSAITTTAFEVYLSITIACIIVLIWASPRYGSKTILIDLGLVGLFGGYTALSTKGVASMLSYTLWRALTTPVTYLLLAVLISTAVAQVKYVNKALQRFDSTQVIPVQFVMFTLSVIMGSAILYRDFEKATAENVGKFIGGCLLTFFGVFLITSGRSRQDDEDEEEESDDEGEERIGLIDQETADGETMTEDDSIRRGSFRRDSILQSDGASEDQASELRRNSHISFADTEPPRTPRAQSNSSQKPTVHVVPPPQTSDQSSPFLTNPWKTSSDDLLQPSTHPGLQATISSPILPSEAQLTTSSPGILSRTYSQGDPHTHPNEIQAPQPPQADRPMTPIRHHSIARMLPGPLLSPLSGGLSVVVADSLRRGMNPRGKSFRRPKLGLKKTISGSQRAQAFGDDDALGTSPSKNGDGEQNMSKSLESGGGSERSRVTRARSLSNTLGDLFKSKRQKVDRPDTAGDEESGPSGS